MIFRYLPGRPRFRRAPRPDADAARGFPFNSGGGPTDRQAVKNRTGRWRWGVLLRRGLVLAVWVGVAGCGDDPEETTSATVEPAPPARTAPVVEPEVRARTSAAPSIDRIVFEPETPTAGAKLRAVVEASDADSENLWFRYAWTIDGEPVRGAAAELDLGNASRGETVEVTVVASDGVNESEPEQESATLENAPPRLVRVEVLPAGELIAGTTITVRPEVRDADGDPVTLEYEWSVNGRDLRESGASLETKSLKRGDRVAVQIVASDGEDESEPFTTPALEVVNTPPRFVSKPGKPSSDGVFRYRVAAEDPDGDLGLQFHLEKAPEGMEIDSASGAILWVPRRDQVGVHTVSVIADDLRGGRSRQNFDVTVGAPDQAPPPPASEG